jgi:hypothetical protein
MVRSYFAKRVERSGEEFGRLLEKECFQPMIGDTEKSGKNNFDTYKNRVVRNL